MSSKVKIAHLSLYGYSHQNPLKFVDPDGNSPASALQLISKYRQTINWAAGVHGVSPQAIASIIFQEKLEGPWATLADIPARAHAGAFNSDKANRRSIGLAEMQVGRAAELLGLDISNRGDQKKAIAALDNDTTSIDLIARNIADYQKKLDRPLTVKEATVGHNAGEKGLMSFVKGEVKNTSRQNLF